MNLTCTVSVKFPFRIGRGICHSLFQFFIYSQFTATNIDFPLLYAHIYLKKLKVG